MVLSETLFRGLINYLHQNTQVISPREISTFPKSNRPRVLLTFDDGWVDNLEIAQPYLADARMTACFFIVTSLAGRLAPFWPEKMIRLLCSLHSARRLDLFDEMIDTLRAAGTEHSPELPSWDSSEGLLSWLKQFPAQAIRAAIAETLEHLNYTGALDHGTTEDARERLLSWDQVRYLHDAGHDIGSHAHTHELLPLLNQTDLIQELRTSRDSLMTHLPSLTEKPLWLSYPNGASNDIVTRAAKDAGYEHAFIASTGVWTSTSNPYLIPRINVWDGTLIDADGAFCEKHLEYSLYWRPIHARPLT
jgi:peptidoglycan/xylan/chitin deacetylase (PgdA/CDA1 family)